MTQKYFDNLPNLYYNNKLVKDITRRTKFVDETRNSPYLFYPYDIQHNLRSDTLAEYYYKNSQLDWLIYMSNGIVDPYYGWYLNDYQFEKLMIEKYGSVENSIKRIKYYRTNWSNDDREISVSFYENTLAQSLKKYFVPNWAVNSNRIVSYKRKQEDIMVNTNRIIDFTVSNTHTTQAHSNGELIDIKIVGGGTATVGTGEIITANSTIIRVQHVSGNTSANNTHPKYIVGETTGANVTSEYSVILKENLTLEEEVFWSPVSYFDYEEEQNESKKTLLVLGTEVKDLAVESFQRAVQEDMDPVTRLVETD